MSFKIGKIHLLIGFTGIIFFLYLFWKKKISIQIGLLVYWFIGLLTLSLFFMLAPSKFLWDFLPGFAYIQYPWRFLNFTLFFLSIMASFIFLSIDRIKQAVVATIFIAFI